MTKTVTYLASAVTVAIVVAVASVGWYTFISQDKAIGDAPSVEEEVNILVDKEESVATTTSEDLRTQLAFDIDFVDEVIDENYIKHTNKSAGFSFVYPSRWGEIKYMVTEDYRGEEYKDGIRIVASGRTEPDNINFFFASMSGDYYQSNDSYHIFGQKGYIKTHEEYQLIGYVGPDGKALSSDSIKIPSDKDSIIDGKTKIYKLIDVGGDILLFKATDKYDGMHSQAGWVGYYAIFNLESSLVDGVGFTVSQGKRDLDPEVLEEFKKLAKSFEIIK